jgi:hypothetical protein
MNTLTLISLLIVGALHVIGLVVLVWSAGLAPEGYESADGFHVTAKSGTSRRLVGDPAELDWDGGDWKRTA